MLDGTRLTFRRPGGPAEERQLSTREVPEALAERFGIVLDAGDTARLVAELDHLRAASGDR
jgi:hypothetical protein